METSSTGPGLPDDPLARVASFLAEIDAVRLAVAFGSLARGRGHRRSDLDLLLLLEPDEEATRRRIEPGAGRAAGRAVDLVYAQEAPPLLRFQVARDGRVLVEREAADWVRFKAQAMVDWWDWAPTARRMHAAALDRLRREVAVGRP